jgi:hypothetical protein
VVVPANTPVSATFRVTAFGSVIQAASTTPSFTLRLRVGGLAGASLAANTFLAVSNASPLLRPWQVQGHVTIVSTGTSGTWFGNLTGTSQINNTASSTVSTPLLRTDGSSPSTRDTTVSQSLALTGGWDTASASNTLTVYGWVWERIF